MKNKPKLIILITLAVIIVLFTYKLYAPYTIQEFNAVNLKNIKQIQENTTPESYSFVVTGNIKNSISIFDKKILKKLQNSPPDFILSTGNNVVNSGEGKYRVLYRTLQKMEIPFVTSVGENEIDDEGYKNYYKYFGPFYFTFALENSYFIFLDTTGHSPDIWQREWLEKELESSRDYRRCFVIMNKPPFQIKVEDEEEEENPAYISDPETRLYYQNIFSNYEVDAVFSSNIQVYHRENIKGVNYIISGGAGGELIVDSDRSFYHYLQVKVTPEGMEYNLKKLESSPGPASKILVNLWVALQSFLYTNYLNIIIFALILFMVGFIIYRELTRKVNYYRNFKELEKVPTGKKLKIAMFTNNYLPVIGGVPISIERLASGLKKLGHEVYIFAPEYPDCQDENKQDVIRCKLLFHTHKEGMIIPVTNIFSRKFGKKIKELDIDLIHCHHPFWMGKKGLALAQKYEIPAVFTYHTRLEKYSHFLPNIFFLRKIFENRYSHFMIKRFANKCEAIFAPTDSTREYLRNVGVRKPIKVLPTGVDMQKYKNKKEKTSSLRKKYVKEKEILLITVSRLSKEKNLYFLLQGIKYIKEHTDRKFKCLIIGDGPEKENVEKYITKNNLQKQVKLLGAVDYNLVSKYYLIGDIFIFASTSETQGLVLLEAMAGKTPVVAVRSSGTDDIIENQVNGYKTEEKIKKWTKKVIKLMENQELRKQLSKNAQNIAEKHSIKNMAAKVETVYLKLNKT